MFLAGFALGTRFLYFFFTAQPSGHIQSLILAAILITLSFHLVTLGLLADLIGANQKLAEEQLLRIKRLRLISVNRNEISDGKKLVKSDIL